MASFKLVLKRKVKNILSPVTVRSFDNFRNKGKSHLFFVKMMPEVALAPHRLLRVNVCVILNICPAQFSHAEIWTVHEWHKKDKQCIEKQNLRSLKWPSLVITKLRFVVEKLFIVTGAEIAARQNSLNGLPTINLFLFKYSLCKYRVLKMAY